MGTFICAYTNVNATGIIYGENGMKILHNNLNISLLRCHFFHYNILFTNSIFCLYFILTKACCFAESLRRQFPGQPD